MDTITRFLENYSYRFPKGYPDMNNLEDKALLYEILEELNVINENFRPLSFFDLKKRGGFRFKIITDKIANSKPFSLNQGTPKILTFINPEYQTAFENADDNKIKQLAGSNINSFMFFEDEAGEEYSIQDLSKDKDFGGRGVGSGTVVEDSNLKALNDKIQSFIEKNDVKSINVIVNGKLFEGIVGAETQPNTPKADFNLITLDKNNNIVPVVFISYKKAGGKGASAGDFIRWSGYTKYADHPEVKAFNEALVKFLQDNNLQGLPNESRFIAPIQDSELIQKLIYGPDYGGENSKDNVNIILQGEINLLPKGNNTYELTAQYIQAPPSLPKGDYQPYLTAAYRADRKMFGIPNNEAIAITKAIAYNASNVYELKNNEFNSLNSIVKQALRDGDYVKINSGTNVQVGKRVLGYNGYFGKIVSIKDDKYKIVDDADGDKTSINRKNLEARFLIEK
jgi:ribosomal protein L21E